MRTAASCSGASRSPWRSASQPKATVQSTPAKVCARAPGRPVAAQRLQARGQPGLGAGERRQRQHPTSVALSLVTVAATSSPVPIEDRHRRGDRCVR